MSSLSTGRCKLNTPIEASALGPINLIRRDSAHRSYPVAADLLDGFFADPKIPEKLKSADLRDDDFRMPSTEAPYASQYGFGQLRERIQAAECLAIRSVSPLSRFRNLYDASATILGEDHWKWLAEELKTSAELRAIASNVQAVACENVWQNWATFRMSVDGFF